MGASITSRRWRGGYDSAATEFDSCAGSGGQARRPRQSMCGGDERQELHHSNLAFGNACSVCLAQRLSTARPPFAARVLAATVCARPSDGRARIASAARRPQCLSEACGVSHVLHPLARSTERRHDTLCPSSSALRGFLRRRARRPESSHQSKMPGIQLLRITRWQNRFSGAVVRTRVEAQWRAKSVTGASIIDT